MKKILAIALATLLLLTLFAGCGKKTGEYAAKGNYLCTSMTSAGLTLDPSAMGLDITLILNNDGTGTLKFAGEETEPEALTWKEEDGDTLSFTIGNETISGSYDGKAVTINMEEDYILVFTKN